MSSALVFLIFLGIWIVTLVLTWIIVEQVLRRFDGVTSVMREGVKSFVNFEDEERKTHTAILERLDKIEAAMRGGDK